MKKQRHGFTLVEILAALAFLSIALLGFHQGQAGSVKIARSAEFKIQAVALAQMKMTETELQIEKKGFQSFLEDEKGGFENKAFSQFHWKRKVTRVDLGCFMPAPKSADESGQGGFFQIAQKFFEESVRKVEVIVEWELGGRPQETRVNQLYVRSQGLGAF